MSKLNGFLHDLEHFYYDGKHWVQNITLDDAAKGRVLSATGVVLLLYYFVRKFCDGGVCKSKARLDGKTIIITGSNAGIGLETAKDFYRRGARVIMACRNSKKASKESSEIKATCQNKDGAVLGEIVNYPLDLSSMKSIREFATNVIEKEGNIDILVNNAGLTQPINQDQYLTEDGFDLTIGTNHLGPFLLTNLLLDKLSNAKHKPARIVNVSSQAYLWGRIHTEDLNFARAGSFPGAFAAYGQSKLCNILFTHELKKRTEHRDISTYVLHPGTVRTKIVTDNFPWYLWLLTKYLGIPLLWLFAKSAVQGAQTTIYCAVDESIAHDSGKFYCDCKETPLKPIGKEEDTAEKLWMLSENLVKLKSM